MGKSKVTKKLTIATPEMFVKMTGHSTPKFAHNAIAANKDVVWSYEFWLSSDPKNKGEFDLEMDLKVCKGMNENKQSEHMNDAAIAFVEKQYPSYKGSVKLTSK